MDKALFSSLRMDWNTPEELYQLLNQEFDFNDDPCPEGGIFGLDREWKERSFVNPPYGPQIKEWIEKALIEIDKNKLAVFLIPARTDTKWFHELILPNAREIRFIKGRLKFTLNGKKGRAPFPSMIIIFDGRKDE